MIAKPFSPGNAFPADEVAKEKLAFDKAMIGSCTNGGYDDLMQAALVIRAAQASAGSMKAAQRVRDLPGLGRRARRRSSSADPRLDGESIAQVFRECGRRDPRVVVRTVLRPGPGLR